jgi:hypothetical protein
VSCRRLKTIDRLDLVTWKGLKLNKRPGSRNSNKEMDRRVRANNEVRNFSGGHWPGQMFRRYIYCVIFSGVNNKVRGGKGAAHRTRFNWAPFVVSSN